jgi:hypothetical protein
MDLSLACSKQQHRLEMAYPLNVVSREEAMCVDRDLEMVTTFNYMRGNGSRIAAGDGGEVCRVVQSFAVAFGDLGVA